MQPADLIIRNAREILTCAGPAPLTGSRQRETSPVSHGALAAHQGRIVYVGPSSELDRHVSAAAGAVQIDASGQSIVPGFVDAHTHAVFAGDRRHELRRRLAGATYAEIAAAGGGIVSTVEATRAASETDLVEQTRVRLDEMLACGTTKIGRAHV